MAPQLTRRTFLTATAGVVTVGVAGGVGYSLPHGKDAGSRAPAKSPTPAKTPTGKVRAAKAPDTDVAAFKTRPDLTPPRVSVMHRETGAAQERAAQAGGSRLFFLAPKGYPKTGPGTQGPMIVDRRGELVWFLPLPGQDRVPMDFQVQTYHGEPVLTWWQGSTESGHGWGKGIIADSSYRQIATVEAARGQRVDLHEFSLTSTGTALITAYRTDRADLSSVGGPATAEVLHGLIQEIDVKSGRLLFSWDSADHIALAESMVPPSRKAKAKAIAKAKEPWDYFHINSVAEGPDNSLLVSARNTCALYQISRTDGRIRWRMGGRKSDFTMGRGTRFYWQHDARPLSTTRISLFDDASSPPKEAQSRGVILAVDPARKSVSLVREYTHPSRLLADNQGSMQVLADGGVCVGWGAEPYFSEYGHAGDLVLDARMPAGDQSYRTYTADWVGRPTDSPTVAVGSNPARGATVTVSWNGATEVDQWRVIAGRSAGSLSERAAAPHAGFETEIAVNDEGPYFGVVALDRNGKVLGRATPVRLHA